MTSFRPCRFALATAVLAIVAVPPGAGIADEAKVFASNYPLAYFAQRIGGDPAFWRPLAEDVIAMQVAEVILLNGAGYEK